MSTQTSKRVRFKLPNTYALIFIFIILAALLTYIIPAGKYDIIQDEVSGRKIVDVESFKFVEQTPVSIKQFLDSIPTGLTKAGNLIFMVFLVGGFFKIVTDTGAIDAGFDAAIRKFESKALLIIPILMFIITFLGAFGVLVSSAIAFIPIGLAIAKKLKLDPICGVAMIYLASYSGFVTSPIGPFNTLIGQSIAGLPPASGAGLRSVVWVFVFIATVIYTFRYAKKVREDNSNSLLDEIRFSDDIKASASGGEFTLSHMLIILVFIGGFILYGVGTKLWKWGTSDLGAVMVAIGVLSGIIGRMSLDDMAKSFLQGCRNMVFGALIIGLARSITVVLEQGNIIHTIIYYMSIPLGKVGPILSSLGMFLSNLIFNFFVPSGSGQGMIVMPIMAPLSDIVGVTRQIAVSAYQYGDGMSNIIIPTSGVLMGVIGLAGIPYSKWLKWVFPLFLIWVGIGAVSLIVATMIGWA